MTSQIGRSVLVLLVLLTATAPQLGCLSKSEQEVVVYSALDREFSESILNDIGGELNLVVRPKYDQESNKTVGLATELIQSRLRPQADVFWNNEILHTVRLEKLGLLEPFEADSAAQIPPEFRSPTGHWYGFAARARVLIVNTNVMPDAASWPKSVEDLANPKWKGKCAVARPVFGTTATHAAVLIATFGPKNGMSLLRRIASNAAIQGGNKQVAQKVAAGQFAFGLTDTDDAMIEIERGEPVTIVFPDQGENQIGTLLIPNTLAIVKNGPNTDRGKRLANRLLAADVEQRLAAGPSAQYPLLTKVKDGWRVEQIWRSGVEDRDVEFKTLKADFRAAADAWNKYKSELGELR
jgi:iron(III) transport system substrate-binding protein